jgi:LacI family transcriptional regulator
MNPKRPTMSDVARRAGVSSATVSNVLGGRRPVSAALAERVLSAAADLDYYVDPAASQLRSGRARAACVLVPDITNPFFAELVGAMEAAARQERYDLIVASSGDDPDLERARLKALLAWRPAGMLVVPCDDVFAGRDLLLEAGIPFVVVDRVPDDIGTDAVLVGNEEAAAEGVRHLLALGHRNVVLVASKLALGNMRARCAGAAQAWREAGQAGEPEVLETGFSVEAAAGAIADRLRRSPRPTAVFALNTAVTLGALAALSTAGLKAPSDVALLGFDDYAWMRVASPPVTAIRQPVGAMGEAAWRRLVARLRGEAAPPCRLRLACTLEVRASTAGGAAASPRPVPERGSQLTVIPGRKT